MTPISTLRTDTDQPPEAGQRYAVVPVAVLEDPRLSIQARVLYGTLQLTPAFDTSEERGYFNTKKLSRLAGATPQTLRRAVKCLTGARWLAVEQENRCTPYHFTLLDPYRRAAHRKLQAAKKRLKHAPFLGEALMREYLSLLVKSDEYDDDMSPGFLVNPFTKEEMELDRYYPPSVAFEFNGPQHYGPTARYPDKEEVKKQQARDDMKLGICRRRGIELVVLHAEDLKVGTIRHKIEGLLPLRPLEKQDELVLSHLESLSHRYRRRARQQFQTAKGTSRPGPQYVYRPGGSKTL